MSIPHSKKEWPCLPHPCSTRPEKRFQHANYWVKILADGETGPKISVDGLRVSLIGNATRDCLSFCKFPMLDYLLLACMLLLNGPPFRSIWRAVPKSPIIIVIASSLYWCTGRIQELSTHLDTAPASQSVPRWNPSSAFSPPDGGARYFLAAPLSPSLWVPGQGLRLRGSHLLLVVAWSVFRVLCCRVSGYRIRNILLRQVLINVWILFRVAAVALHVLAPYSRIDFAVVLKILNWCLWSGKVRPKCSSSGGRLLSLFKFSLLYRRQSPTPCNTYTPCLSTMLPR